MVDASAPDSENERAAFVAGFLCAEGKPDAEADSFADSYMGCMADSRKRDQEPGIMPALARIEARQAAYEQVAHKILSTMEVHNEKLDAILEAATRTPGPSAVAEALQNVVASIQEQTRLLTSLPGVLAVAIREELERDMGAEDPCDTLAFD